MRKVLIVDDEMIMRQSIRALIDWEKLGLTCAGCCASGVEALDILTEEKIDILMTDIKMPVLSGLDLIERAKKMYPVLQCVVLSGYAEFALAQEAIRNGVLRYLLKPCSKKELEDVLRRCCENIDTHEHSMAMRLEQREQLIESLCGKILQLHRSEKEITAERLGKLIQKHGSLSLLSEAMVRIIVQISPTWDLRRLLNELSSYENEKQLLIAASNILRELPRDVQQESFVYTMQSYIEEHYADSDLTLQFVADNVVHMNAKYIGKQFYKITGKYFSEYLQYVRIEQAKHLLQEDAAYKINSIAEQTGFGNHVQYFYQVFRKIVKKTPSEYRDEMKLPNCTKK